MTSLRTTLAQLAGLPPLTLAGQPVTGAELVFAVAINPEQPYAEAMRTPQVIAELGRATAAALRAKDDAELEYRIWRDSLLHKLTNDLDVAKLAGFECALNPGTDAKGNAKEAKTPSQAAVDVYLRLLPEYREHYQQQNAAAETWAAFHAALEGAKARQWAVRMKEDNGGNQTEPEVEEAGPTWTPDAPSPVVVQAAPPPPSLAVPPLPALPPPPPSFAGDNDEPALAGMRRKGKAPPPPLPALN